jgi:hypothetical protein
VAVATHRPQHGRVVSVVVFDVNETLSDLVPMAGRFEDPPYATPPMHTVRSLPELAAQL